MTSATGARESIVLPPRLAHAPESLHLACREQARREPPPPTPPPVVTPPSNREQAVVALVTLGWKRGVATAAVDEAMGHVARGEDVAIVIRDALRRCPRPFVG